MSYIDVKDGQAVVEFSSFDLDSYDLFLRCKQLPESQLSYAWQGDTYTLTTPERFAAQLGFTTSKVFRKALPLADHLFDYQRFIVETALEAKRYAVWADTGLGKTAIFLEWARQVVHLTGGRVLILSPLQIIEQTREEARHFYGDAVSVDRLNTREDVVRWCKEPGPQIGIATHHKLAVDVVPELRYLAGLVIDESAILKSGGGVIKWNLIKSGRGIPYKLSCTATPAPNDTMEYASQAGFLEKLRTEGEILWTFFSRDKEGKWRVKPHAKEAFYCFMASWSIYLRDPAHYGWKDILSTLPPPNIQEYRLDVLPGQLQLASEFIGSKKAFPELFAPERLGIRERIKLSQIAKGFIYDKGKAQRLESPKPLFVTRLVENEVAKGHSTLVWTVFDEESEILRELLPQAEVLDGSMTDGERQRILDRFRNGDCQILISKAALVGFGMNFQHCRAMVFSGFDDSFERLYQAIRRAYRFGQTETVSVHIPYIPELEGLMFHNVKRKQAQFDQDTEIQELNYLEVLQERL